jgi:ABC-type Na+ transport system ATPase subunit NatA
VACRFSVIVAMPGTPTTVFGAGLEVSVVVPPGRVTRPPSICAVPVTALDPDGVLWIRNLLKSLAAEGRTVFVSSHPMSEMALTADRLIIIGRGRLIADTTIEDLLQSASGNHIRVRSPEAGELVARTASGGPSRAA